MSQSKNKVALCYSGLPNLEVEAVDIFLEKIKVTPSTVDLIACFWNINANKDKIRNFEKRFNSSHVLYIEPEIPDVSFLKSYLKYPVTNVGRTLCMLFIRKKLLEILKNQNKIYHSYIITRPDIFIEKNVNIFSSIENFSGDLGKCNLYLPYAGNYCNGLTDNLVFADHSGMEAYLSVIDRLEYILNSRDNYIFPKSFLEWAIEICVFFILLLRNKLKHLYRVPLHPENLIRKNIELSGLKVGYFDCGKLFIKRKIGVTKLRVMPTVPSLTNARSLEHKYINDANLTINVIFNIKKS